MKVDFYISRSYSNYTSDDRVQILSDINEMLDTFGYLMNVLIEKKIPVEDYQYPISTLINKYVIHLYTIVNLINGMEIRSKYLSFEKRIIDISSIYSLTRIAIENYLTFYYLYIQPKNHFEGSFRFMLFELAGLNSRQRFNAENDEHVKIKESEKKRIIELEKVLYNHTLFNELNKTTRDIIKGRKSARIFSWEKLIREADLNPELFLNQWFIYSEHVHSEYVSQVQLFGFLTEELSSVHASDNVCNLLLSLTSIFVVDFFSLFKEVEDRYNSLDQDIKNVIDFFNSVGRKYFES